MARAFEPGGFFYGLLAADSARWEQQEERRPVRRRAHPSRAVLASRRRSDQSVFEELEDLRHRLAEAERSTEERKALFARELNKLQLERQALLSRVTHLTRELEKARAGTLTTERAEASRALSVRRGLAATSGIATATGVLQLALLIRNTFQQARRPRWLGLT